MIAERSFIRTRNGCAISIQQAHSACFVVTSLDATQSHEDFAVTDLGKNDRLMFWITSSLEGVQDRSGGAMNSLFASGTESGTEHMFTCAKL